MENSIQPKPVPKNALQQSYPCAFQIRVEIDLLTAIMLLGRAKSAQFETWVSGEVPSETLQPNAQRAALALRREG